jgi:hypothetical protein
MDQVFSSQFLAMQAAFQRAGIDIEVAYTPSGEVDYVYQADRLLVSQEQLTAVLGTLSGAIRAREEEQPERGRLVVISTAALEPYRSVPDTLDFLDAQLGITATPSRTDLPVVTPVHVLHIASGRLCPADEPEVPCPCGPDEPCEPCPPRRKGHEGAGVVIGICDTGLLADTAAAPWLAGVTGDLDPLGPVLPGGLHAIPRYCGHGTFGAGVTRCEAPEADVYVGNFFPFAGGTLETNAIQKLQQMIARNPAPQIVNLSAGSYSRNDWQLLSFSEFAEQAGGITLTAAAGNDATDRPFWPAAFDWAVGVGALGADRRNRAWFSNYGDWVDVYAPGEGLVNAFATGLYTYQEPPKRPAVQVFEGCARWSGTSFAAPLVAGLVAATMSEAGLHASDAAQALLARAQGQAIPGLGPVLYAA